MTPAQSRILVVDDDAALLDALPETLRLRMPDVTVETADSAVAALDRIASADYDVIVTDIKMPGLDGLGLLERIHEIQPDTPALVITGHGEHDLAIRSLRAGAFDYVPKPIDREYFIAALHRAVHVRGLRRQVAEQQQALRRRADALEQVVEARTETLRHRADRARILAEAGAAIHSARDVVQILQAVADAARRLSDASVAVAGCAERSPEGGLANQRTPWNTAVATLRGASRPSDQQTAQALAACASRYGTRHENGDAPLGPEWPWSLAVPMRSREGDLRGGIILGRHEPPPDDADEDLQLKMRVLARQTEVALENALLYQRERKIAETLQRSLLPGELPEIPGVALDARYLPGRPDAVGGDWYDVFLLPSGQLGVVMGDVAGRGVWAAAVMGQLRNALRAFALEGDPPALVAARLNRFIPAGTMATLLYMVFDPDTMEARYVNLGHVPPVVVAPGATTSFLEGGAPPLGAKLWFTYKEDTAVITPGSTIVLYTDGLVETRGMSIDDGLSHLARVLADKSNGDIASLLDHVLANAVTAGTDAGDDIAVLALRPLPLDATRLALRLPAVPSSLSQLRQTLRRWLAASGLAADPIYEITTACNEACANAIEHAYGPADATYSFEASLVDGRLTVIVADTGRWRVPHASHRGLGLTIMRALMETVDVDSGPGGTTVRMERRATATVPT